MPANNPRLVAGMARSHGMTVPYNDTLKIRRSCFLSWRLLPFQNGF